VTHLHGQNIAENKHCFTEAFSEGDDSDVPIFLGDEDTSVRFTEAHMHDLITILNSD